MEINLTEHLERMKRMCDYFYAQSLKNPNYLPEYSAAKEINSLLQHETNKKLVAKKVASISEKVDVERHANNVQWLDYKIHVRAYIRHTT